MLKRICFKNNRKSEKKYFQVFFSKKHEIGQKKFASSDQWPRRLRCGDVFGFKLFFSRFTRISIYFDFAWIFSTCYTSIGPPFDQGILCSYSEFSFLHNF